MLHVSTMFNENMPHRNNKANKDEKAYMMGIIVVQIDVDTHKIAIR